MRKEMKTFFAVMTVALMMAVAIVPAVGNDNVSDAATAPGSIPEMRDYGYVIKLDSTSSVQLSAVVYADAQTPAGEEIYSEANGTASTIPEAMQTGVFSFNSTTGLGPFNSFYAAINIATEQSAYAEDESKESRINNQIGGVAYVLNPDNLKETLAGTAYTPQLYNIMLVIPAVYWDVYTDDDGNTYLCMSNTSSFRFDSIETAKVNLSSYASFQANAKAYAHTFTVTEGSTTAQVTFPYIALGVYEGYRTSNDDSSDYGINSGQLVSQPDQVPSGSTREEGFRASAKVGNEDNENGTYMLWNYYQWTLHKIMSYTVMGNMNSQLVMGFGNTGTTTGLDTGAYTGRLTTEASSSLTGATSKAYQVSENREGYGYGVSLFLENSWGSVWEYVDDVMIHEGNLLTGRHLVVPEGTLQSSDLTDTGVDWVKTGTSGKRISQTSTAAAEWNTPIATDSQNPTVDGDMNDAVSFRDTGDRVLIVSGNYRNALNAGVARVSADSALTATGSDFGARLAYVMTADATVATTALTLSGGDEPGSATAVLGQTSVSDLIKPQKTGYDVEGYYIDDQFETKIMDVAGNFVSSVEVYTEVYTDANGGWIWSKGPLTLYVKWTESVNVVVNSADELIAVLELGAASQISFGDDIVIQDQYQVDLEFASLRIYLDDHVLVLDNGKSLKVENTIIYSGGDQAIGDVLEQNSFIFINDGHLVNVNSDIYTPVIFGEDGSVDNTRAKNETRSGSTTGDVVRVGYGNTLTVSDYRLTSNNNADIYGKLVLTGSNTIAAGANMYVLGEMVVQGTMTVTGSLYDFGTVTLHGDMAVAGDSRSNASSLLHVQPVKPAVVDNAYERYAPLEFAYDDSGWGFRVMESANVTIAEASTVEYTNTLYIAGANGGFNAFRVDGTLDMDGLLTGPEAGNAAALTAVITNNGLIRFNGTSDMLAADLQSGAIVISMLDGSELGITKVDGAILIEDRDACGYDAYGMDQSKYDVDGSNIFAAIDIRGLKVSEGIFTKVTSGVKYYYSCLNISGTVAAQNETGGSMIDISKGTAGNLQSKIVVSDDLYIGEKVEFLIHGGLTEVASDATVTALLGGQPDDKAIKVDTQEGYPQATLTVHGKVIVGGKEHTAMDFSNGVLNASAFTTIDAQTYVTTYYTNADAALAAIATADGKEVKMYGTNSVERNFALEKGQKLTLVGDNAELVISGTVEVGDNAVVQGPGHIDVEGTLAFENYFGSYRADEVVSDVVFDNYPARTYASLSNAVVMPGVTKVILGKDVSLYEDLTVPSGVQVYSTLYGITVGKNCIFTVDGEVVLTRGTIQLTVPDKVESTPAKLVVNGCVITKDYINNNEDVSATVNGAHYDKAYEGSVMHYISSAAIAAQNMSAGDVRMVGSVSAKDVTFTHDPQKDALMISVPKSYAWKWDSTQNEYVTEEKTSVFTMDGLVLDGASMDLTAANGGFATGTVKASTGGKAVGQIALTQAKGIIIASDSEETATGIDAFMYLSGTQAGTLTVEGGTVTIADGYEAQTTATSRFTVASGAQLDITSAVTLGGTYVTIAGDVLVTGAAGVLTTEGTTAVSGTIAVSKKGDLTVKGTMNLTGTIDVSDARDLEGSFNLSGTGAKMAKLVVGVKPAELGANAAVAGTVIINEYAYVKVYGGASVGGVTDTSGAADNVISAAYHVNGTGYMDVIAIDGAISAYLPIYDETFALKGLDNGIRSQATGLYAFDKESKLSSCWYTSASYTASKLIYTHEATSPTKITSVVKAFYGLADPAKVYGTVTVGTGLDLYVDGKNYEPKSYYGEEDFFTVGTHSVYVQFKTGYEWDDVTIKFNGSIVPATATGGTFTITADMTEFTLVADGAEPYTPDPTPEEKSEWTVTTILLCIVVVLIAVMAVIVALRLNRS